MLWSFSRLSVLEDCLYRFNRHYLMRERGPKTTPLITGTVVHSTLEQVMRQVKESQHKGPLSAPGVLDLYGRIYHTEYPDGGTSVVSFEDGEKMVREWVTRVGVVDHETIEGVEVRFEHELENGIRLMGYIDLLESQPDGSILVRDYKTGGYVNSRDEMDQSLQISIYIIAARAMFPGRHVRGCFDMLRHGFAHVTERTDEQLETVERYIKTLVDKAGAAEQSGEYPANVNRFCTWCDHKAVCGDYQSAINGPVPELAGDDWASIAAQREYLTLKGKLVKDAAAALDRRIKEAIKERGGPIVAGDWTYELSKTNRSTYKNVSGIADKLSGALGGTAIEWIARCATLDKTKVKRAVKAADIERGDQMILQAEIDALATDSISHRLNSTKTKSEVD